MLLSDIETAVRQDLFDPLGGPNQRWQTSDIDRAIDKAIDRYTMYYPNIVFTDMQMQPYQRTYPYPQSWNTSYPVLWIERVLYPLQVYGSQYASPSLGASLTTAAGTGLGIGLYQYAQTFLTQGGETTPGPMTGITTTSGNQQVALSNIPIAPVQPLLPGVATNTVIGRNLYRTLVGGSLLYLLATIPDNTTSTYTDTSSDSALTGRPRPPSVNSSGVMVWPASERNFAEYSNMYNSSTALAAGGNLGIMGSIGVGSGPTGTQAPSFTLALSSAELPKDNTLLMRVFYATKATTRRNREYHPGSSSRCYCTGSMCLCNGSISSKYKRQFLIPGRWA